MTLFKRIRHLLANKLYPYTPLVEVGIARDNILHNLRAYQEQYPGFQLAPVLKSNAYGHDLGLVARLLDSEPIAFFMVDSLYEARRLRETGIRSRIAVMGYVRPEDIAQSHLAHTDFAITDIEQLRGLALIQQRPLRMHLKLDTGMHRQGILPEELTEAIALIRSNPAFRLVGVASHLADADTADSSHTLVQLERWQAMRAALEAAFPGIEYRHLAATKGARYAKQAGTNVIRLGIGLYGFDTAPGETSLLKIVMEVRSIIGSVRHIKKGESVGYNAAFTAPRDMTIATVPAGYFEGVDRRLSDRGSMLVKGYVCPIVGRVSMNMASIDVSGVPDVRPGDSVVVISRRPEDANSVPAIAAMVSSETYRETPYVILAHIPQHLKRVLD